MGDPARKLDDLAVRVGRNPADPYPADLSDLTPRMRAAVEREGKTLDELRAQRLAQTPQDVEQMLAYEWSMMRHGDTLDDVWDPPPMSDEEKAAFLRDADTWATPEQVQSFKRDLA